MAEIGRSDPTDSSSTDAAHLDEVLESEFRELHGGELKEDMSPTLRERAKAKTLWDTIHNLPDDGRTALCLSGGGVRSSAFNLGVLQGLARLELLKRFHYLSTVSGGGYIGCWLNAWRHRSQHGIAELTRDLSWPDRIGARASPGCNTQSALLYQLSNSRRRISVGR